jgi:hypothetical protein
MANQVLIILSSGEKGKALTGIRYATRAQEEKWLSEVKVILFGPVEKLIVEDEEVQTALMGLQAFETPVACKAISDKQGISERLAGIGLEVDYVGPLISRYIREGYVPLVF